MDPVLGIVIIGTIAGCGYMLLPAFVPRLQAYHGSVYWILGLGFAARITADELLRHADESMYVIKKQGKNSYGFVA